MLLSLLRVLYSLKEILLEKIKVGLGKAKMEGKMLGNHRGGVLYLVIHNLNHLKTKYLSI